jgi:brefeldin A-resistance guanine nucleotide exchange factor 1
VVFELLQTIVDSTPATVTADNYESAVALANDFASAGSICAIEERQRDALTRRSKAKQVKVRYEDFSYLRSLILMKIVKIKPSREL